MKIQLDCFPCFLRQVVIALRFGQVDEALHERVIKAALPEIEKADLSKSPAHATTFIHRKIREIIGEDPFKVIKSEYNEKALVLYPTLRKLIKTSEDPLFTAARLAIAGNVIDFGIYTSIDMEGTVKKALSKEIAVDEFPLFKRAVEESTDILYLLDNAGEIVFDMLLIEFLSSIGKTVTAVVKGAPVINDATREDALQAGLVRHCEIIDNGSDCVGTILPMTSPGFRERFEKAPLIISKGQGNFETLMIEKKENVFFLFQAKCGVVAKMLSLPQGAMLLKRLE
jgi:uncharacterized protein with ATP-grasp and redox domains